MDRSKSLADVSQQQQSMYAENASTVAAFNKGGKNGARSWLLSRWFQFLLQQYKSDELFSSQFAYACLLLHFLIISLGISHWNLSQEDFFKIKSQGAIVSLARWVISTLLITTLGVFAASVMYRSEIASKPSLLILSSCVLKHVHWYLVMPLSFLLFSQDLFGVHSSSISSAISSWFIILTGTILIGLIVFMRNQLPSNGKFNSPNRQVETFISFVVLILIAAVRNVTGS